MVTIEQLAEDAYQRRDLTHLQAVGSQAIKQQTSSDKFFWAYLSLNQPADIFFRVYKEEQERSHGDISKEQLRSLKDPIPLQPTPMNNVSQMPPSLISNNIRSFGYDYFVSANQDQAREYLKILLSPDYHVKLGKYLQDRAQNLHKYNRFLDVNPGELMKFDLNALLGEITKYKQVAICGGLPSRCVYQKWNTNPTQAYSVTPIDILDRKGHIVPDEYDVDIFLITQDDNEIGQIVTYIYNLINTMKSRVYKELEYSNETILKRMPWYETEGAIFTTVGLINFQIIKRAYRSLEEILLGFDLDSSAVAYYQGQFIYGDRFHSAVTYGQNVIIPMRQSKSYMYRLHKYLHRGFTILVPGDLNIYPHYQCLRELMTKILILPDKLPFIMSDYLGFLNQEEETIKEDTNKLIKLPSVRLATDILNIFDPNNFTSSSWRKIKPGSQITGTFNPTTYDFLRCQDIDSLETRRLFIVYNRENDEYIRLNRESFPQGGGPFPQGGIPFPQGSGDREFHYVPVPRYPQWNQTVSSLPPPPPLESFTQVVRREDQSFWIGVNPGKRKTTGNPGETEETEETEEMEEMEEEEGGKYPRQKYYYY